MRSRRRGGLRWVAGLLVLVAVAGVAFWAGRVTLRPAEVVEQSPAEATEIEVVEQELGRVITLTTTVSQPSTPLALNALTGVVTQVSASDEHGQGDVLYTVGETPVVLVEGDVPFWRELGENAEGEDVRQVQQMLTDAGADLQADGEWGSSTTRAVRAWQEERGVEVTGSFEQGSLIASPTLPVNLAIDAGVVWPGGVLSGSEEVVSVAGGDPTFVMEVNQSQAEMLPSGTTVRVQGGTSGWEGVVTETGVTEEGLVALTLTAPDGGLVCGTECEDLPPADSTSLLTEVAIVPPVTGPVVPVAAVTTHPDGSSSVDVVRDGVVEPRDVEVLTVADGLAVIDGVNVGERVRVFGQAADSTPSEDPSQHNDQDTTTESGHPETTPAPDPPGGADSTTTTP